MEKPNPLYGSLGQQNSKPQNNMMNLISQFQEFRKNFKGDAKAQIQELLNSGKMTQDQLDQCEAFARQIQGFLR